jgi:hypothetical protein
MTFNLCCKDHWRKFWSEYVIEDDGVYSIFVTKQKLMDLTPNWRQFEHMGPSGSIEENLLLHTLPLAYVDWAMELTMHLPCIELCILPLLDQQLILANAHYTQGCKTIWSCWMCISSLHRWHSRIWHSYDPWDAWPNQSSLNTFTNNPSKGELPLHSQ